MKTDFQKILKEIEPYRDRMGRINSKRAALLVIDMQTRFYEIAEPILGDVLQVIQLCRRIGIPIIFTQHGHSDQESDGGFHRQWWGQLIMEGTEEWKFIPEMEIESDDIILSKNRYSAFFKTNLDEELQARGIRDIIISGIMTNLCCETTARDAFMRDYRVFFLIDGTSTREEELHLATLKNLGFGFCYLLTCKEFVEELRH